jgi:hypothetical protein
MKLSTHTTHIASYESQRKAIQVLQPYFPHPFHVTWFGHEKIGIYAHDFDPRSDPHYAHLPWQPNRSPHEVEHKIPPRSWMIHVSPNPRSQNSWLSLVKQLKATTP